MPIKVLVISNYRATHSVRPEAEVFIGLQQAGFSVTIMTYGDSEYIQKFREAGIRVIDFHPQKKLDRAEINFIRKELQEGQYDIMHLYNGKAIINGIRAARGLPVKVVLYRGFEGHVRWYDPSAYLKFLHPRVDAILCNALGVEEYLDRARVFVKPRLVTINKGHQLDWYSDIEALTPRELDLPEDAFYAVCAANNRKMKGTQYLLQAMRHLPPEANIHLLLLGRNMDTPENLKIVKQSSHPERVHFLGWRPDSLRVVKMADTFVLPSLYGESITKSVLESMSLATPAIITEIPGNREMIEDGKSGYVVPKKQPRQLADALLKMYNDRAKTREMGQAAKERIRTRFSNRRTIEGYAEFYRSLAAAAS